MNSLKLLLIIFFLSHFPGILFAQAQNLPKEFSFNEKNALEEWEEKVFRNKVIYEVLPKKENGLLSAKSEKACSGLIYKVKFDTEKLPMISWQWKILKFPDKTAPDIKKPENPVSEIDNNFASSGENPDNKENSGKKGWIEKDDYAGRVYVIFPSFIFTDTKSIEYIWSQDLPEETIMTSPYFKNIKLIVIETGTKKRGQWVFEERNIYDDYIKAFGTPPNRKVGAISLMTDTDNTLSSAEAFYKNIKVGYANEEKL